MTKSIKEMTSEELYAKYGKHVSKISHVTQRKLHWAITPEEALQAGWYGLTKMLENYQPRENMTEDEVMALIGMRVRGAVKDEVRKITGEKRSGNVISYTTRKFEIPFEDMEISQVESILACEDSEICGFSFEDLLTPLKNKRHTELLRLMYYYDRSQAEIADTWGVSLSRVSQLHKEALTRLTQYVKRTSYAA